MRTLMILLILMMAASATSAEESNESPRVRKNVELKDSSAKNGMIVAIPAPEPEDIFGKPGQFFFPMAEISEPEPRRYSRQNWYSNELEVMDEAPLIKIANSKDQFVFRFTWLRSFAPHMSIRVTKFANGNIYLSAKRLIRDSNDKSQQQLIQDVRNLKENQWKQLQSKITKAEFFVRPAIVETPFACDGAQWIFEANNSGNYHFVDRWCATGANRDLGIFLLKAASMLPNKKVLY